MLFTGNKVKCYPHPAITFLTKIKPSQKRALFFCFKIQNEKKLTLTREKNREKKLTLTLKKSVCYNKYNKKCEKTKHRKNNHITNIRPFPYGKRFFMPFLHRIFVKRAKLKKTFSYIGASKQITAATVFLVKRKCNIETKGSYMNYYRKKTDPVNCTDKVCFIYAFNL